MFATFRLPFTFAILFMHQKKEHNTFTMADLMVTCTLHFVCVCVCIIYNLWICHNMCLCLFWLDYSNVLVFIRRCNWCISLKSVFKYLNTNISAKNSCNRRLQKIGHWKNRNLLHLSDAKVEQHQQNCFKWSQQF